MATVRIVITTGNAAFADGNEASEVGRILEDLALDMRTTYEIPTQKLRDINGNTVGSIKRTGGMAPPETRTQKICVQCKQKFTPSRMSEGRYCSETCYHAHHGVH